MGPNQKPKKKKKLFKNKPKEEEKKEEPKEKTENGTEEETKEGEDVKKETTEVVIKQEEGTLLPASPENCIVKPIPIKPKPGQTITLSDVANLDRDKSEKTSSKSGLLSLAGSLGVTPKPLKDKS